MKRREFIGALGAVATSAWPFGACAHQMPVIGFLHSSTPGPSAKRVEGFRKGLAEPEFVEGRKCRHRTSRR